MATSRNGKFSFVLGADVLSKGLRKEENNPVNAHTLISCAGMIGKNGVLQKITDLTRTVELSVSFPYPQIFVETSLIIVCTDTKIYTYADDALTLELTVLAGSTWSLISSHDYIYMSNGRVSVIRNPEEKVFAEDSTVPTAMAMFNFNGQVIIGSPNGGYA
ncbi:MAG: hypothetical protein GY861_16760 [bacterium]|nr:hypothetical protein [bacterium]